MFRLVEDNLGGFVPPIFNPYIMTDNEKEINQFIRIANARYGKRFKFKPQRREKKKKMYRAWKERQ